MAFIQITAPTGQQTGNLLSADNITPERHIVIATLRTAAPLMGLTAPVITTLDAMLSCLPPKRNHHTVFASNNTLTFRRNGISDRTIRRHAAILQDLGLVVRRDSPNKKRFTRQNKADGKALRFGFDFTPLFSRLREIAEMAAEVLREKDRVDYLRCKIRAAVNQRLVSHPNDPDAIAILRVLRRKLTLIDCQALLSQLPITDEIQETDADPITDAPTKMSVNNGQIVRHHHKSNIEDTDKERPTVGESTAKASDDRPVTVQEILAACPEAHQFSQRSIQTVEDVVAHARTLAPMIGINAQTYHAAQEKLGAFKTAATIWAIMQFHDKIKTVGAYFRSITTGPRSSGFSPDRLIRRLAAAQPVHP